ncbi:MAG: membrane protein insertion efficiency factor YidD [Geminicoccaceae bacterium]|nr:membrane protein insertion efficiency factor YidD [Geminicoccaceae bacterium]MCB9966524.1 membrane protein insertion efficiency factor YidD [Geminicoccaceae bacterium]HRY25085.1 membrane protein insertion efficiency factor YidD [Geminicoccaceae bacterium]
MPIQPTGSRSDGGSEGTGTLGAAVQWRRLARAVDLIVASFLRLLVHAYRYLLAPVLPRGCRFAPSCSLYALEALARHGAITGGGLALRRLASCHPWGGSGYDPVPAAAPRRGCRCPDSLPAASQEPIGQQR